MLQNEYLVAKIGVDPAENEPPKVRPARATPAQDTATPAQAQGQPVPEVGAQLALL